MYSLVLLCLDDFYNMVYALALASAASPAARKDGVKQVYCQYTVPVAHRIVVFTVDSSLDSISLFTRVFVQHLGIIQRLVASPCQTM